MCACVSKSVTHHNHLGGLQHDALTSAPEAARRSLPETEWKKEKEASLELEKNKFHAHTIQKEVSAHQIKTATPDFLLKIYWGERSQSASVTTSPLVWETSRRAALNGQFPTFSPSRWRRRRNTRLWKSPLSWRHKLCTVRLASSEGDNHRVLEGQQQPWKHWAPEGPTAGWMKNAAFVPTPRSRRQHKVVLVFLFLISCRWERDPYFGGSFGLLVAWLVGFADPPVR